MANPQDDLGRVSLVRRRDFSVPSHGDPGPVPTHRDTDRVSPVRPHGDPGVSSVPPHGRGRGASSVPPHGRRRGASSVPPHISPVHPDIGLRRLPPLAPSRSDSFLEYMLRQPLVEAERVEAERVEAERVEAERLKAERLEAERLEAERLQAERLEAERLEAEEEKRTLRLIQLEVQHVVFEGVCRERAETLLREALEQEMRQFRRGEAAREELAAQGRFAQRGADTSKRLAAFRLEDRVENHRKNLAASAFLLFLGAMLYLSFGHEICHIGRLLWGGGEWYRVLAFIVVGASEFLLLRYIIRRRPLWLHSPWIRVGAQTVCTVFSLIACGEFTDRASITPSFFLALHTVPICLLFRVPDDFSFYDCFVGMGVSCILGHYKKTVVGWVWVFVYVGVMLSIKLIASLMVDQYNVVA